MNTEKIDVYEFCYESYNFEKITNQETTTSRKDLELIEYFVYDHYNERKERYCHYYNLTFDDLYKRVDVLLNRYNFKGARIRESFSTGFNAWDDFSKELTELFNVFLTKNNIHVKRIKNSDDDE